MNVWWILNRWLTALALIGLAMSPMAASSEAMSGKPQSVYMAADMPCCPDDMPMMPDCTKDCPAAVICGFGVLSLAVPDACHAVTQFTYRDGKFPFESDTALASKVGEPPPRPPKA